MANYWMHNGYLQVEGEKMSKSAENFVTIHDLLQDWHGYSWPGEALRFNMLRTHYRQPIDWTFNSLDESHKILWEWYGDLEGLQSENRISVNAIDYLCDDLNTSQLITELHGLRRKRDFQSLLSTLQFLGFSGDKSKLARRAIQVPFVQNNMFEVAAQVARDSHQQQSEHVAKIGSWAVNPPLPLIFEEVNRLIAQRNEARKAKDFEKADRIRDEIKSLGFDLVDNKEGTSTPKERR